MIDYISSDIIHHKTLLNLYTNHILLNNKQLCDCSVTIRLNMVTWTFEFHHYLEIDVINYIPNYIIQHKTLLFYRLNSNSSVNIQMNMVITPDSHHCLINNVITFLATLYNTKHCQNRTQTTFYQLITSFNVTIMMNMVIQTSEYHNFWMIMWIHTISSGNIQHMTCLNQYRHNILTSEVGVIITMNMVIQTL